MLTTRYRARRARHQKVQFTGHHTESENQDRKNDIRYCVWSVYIQYL